MTRTDLYQHEKDLRSIGRAQERRAIGLQLVGQVPVGLALPLLAQQIAYTTKDAIWGTIGRREALGQTMSALAVWFELVHNGAVLEAHAKAAQARAQQYYGMADDVRNELRTTVDQELNEV